VRLAIGPALLCLAGRWNWWPGSMPVRRADAATQPAIRLERASTG